ncbi:hypothetical protein dsx2_1937 [Desulfovibrio sp. X2]|uniref:hypothetical protein n=1 Tax=Desulfovibrio sp. X2 TaxID=941449 RepID=UPI000358C44E|nr:hypothetical protein [Desulfovibrio sp. X2]EPR44009.1 hypothetical protein dsx2_1937 [Desulfovibrio sp. X2]
MSETSPVLYLYDEAKRLHGVLIDPELWEKIEPLVREHLPSSAKAEEPEPPEPMADWETLTAYWDFKYDPDYDVACGVCGESTTDWRADEPRKFRLVGANLGGLVTFKCQKCKAKVIKRHFKDHIKVETQPFQDKKDPRLNAVYDGNRQYFT